jgi:hypothetical protein
MIIYLCILRTKRVVEKASEENPKIFNLQLLFPENLDVNPYPANVENMVSS